MNRSSVGTWLAMAIAGTALGAWLGGSAGAAASGAPQDAELVLAGTWVLNDELSDDPRGRVGERDDDRARRPGGRGGFGGGPVVSAAPVGLAGAAPGDSAGRGGFGGGRDGERPDPDGWPGCGRRCATCSARPAA